MHSCLTKQLTVTRKCQNLTKYSYKIFVVFYKNIYMKQIEYDKRATYTGTIHFKCFRVSRISTVFYKITYMKQIEYDKRATYIGTIYSKCFRVSRISVVLNMYKITYMKQIKYDKCATYIGTIHSKCFECQEYQLSSILCA